MTDLELKKARVNYRMLVEGRNKLLESLANIPIQEFTKQFYPSINEASILSITDDDILRRTFLKAFQNTKESSHIMVFINNILRTNATISDARPLLESINYENSKQVNYANKKLYSLFCDLETNEPVLVLQSNLIDFINNYFTINITNEPETETYYYSSKSLEKINKGKVTDDFNRLQLYYFRELLNCLRKENATQKVKDMTRERKLQNFVNDTIF